MTSSLLSCSNCFGTSTSSMLPSQDQLSPRVAPTLNRRMLVRKSVQGLFLNSQRPRTTQGRRTLTTSLAKSMSSVHLAYLIEQQKQDIDDALTNNTYIVYNNIADCFRMPLPKEVEECLAEEETITARENDATRATIYDLDTPFEEGTFRWVAKGMFTGGNRSGEECVCKWFKSGVVYEDLFFEKDLQVVDKALEIVDEFNQAGIIDVHVRVNRPEIWRFRQGTKYAGQRHLIEPFISNFQKFNSNSGWNDPQTEIDLAMQALSHFSYHISGGKLVLCDLQGGLVKDGAEIVLTDPVILSHNRSYGSCDLGNEGISAFFSKHVCNKFCQHGSWSKPKDLTSHLRSHRGTSMLTAAPQNCQPDVQKSKPSSHLPRWPDSSIDYVAVEDESPW